MSISQDHPHYTQLFFWKGIFDIIKILKAKKVGTDISLYESTKEKLPGVEEQNN